MLKLEKYGNFKSLGKNKEKKQIILCHTSREVGDYLTSLKFRYNGKYDKIPNFVVTRKGEVIKLLDETGYTNFIVDNNMNQKTIIITLENLGWLEKKPLTDHYISWNATIYKGKVFEKKWRDYFFWEPYSEEQIIQTANLCSELCENLRIEKMCVGHNTKIDGMNKFEGICSRSNYDTRFTDLSPSFDFELFIKKIENEQYTQREI